VSENLDLVRSIYASWEQGDWSSADWAHPEIELVMVDQPGAREAKGITAMAAAWRDFLTTWEGYRIEAREYRELSDGRVLVLLQAFGRSRAAGLDLKDVTRGQRGANVFEIRHGEVTRLDAYFDERAALADLGLAE
jgi:ketosteroid isomerase-like protein